MGQQGSSLLNLSVKATGTINQATFTTFAGTQAVAGDATVQGVALYAATSGQMVPVQTMGTAFVQTGGVFAVGDYLDADANGCAMKHTTGKIVGRALNASTGSGQYAEILLLLTASPIVVPVQISTLVGTGASYTMAPVSGIITSISSVINGVLTTGNATLTAAINGSAVTGGVITITQAGSAAGNVNTVSPTANNTVTAGQNISITVGGTNATASSAQVLITILT